MAMWQTLGFLLVVILNTNSFKLTQHKQIRLLEDESEESD